MLKDFMEFLSGTKMTVISAFFLLASLCFMLTGTKAFPDPVWGTIFISGTPIIYKALKNFFSAAVFHPLFDYNSDACRNCCRGIVCCRRSCFDYGCRRNT